MQLAILGRFLCFFLFVCLFVCPFLSLYPFLFLSFILCFPVSFFSSIFCFCFWNFVFCFVFNVTLTTSIKGSNCHSIPHKDKRTDTGLSPSIAKSHNKQMAPTDSEDSDSISQDFACRAVSKKQLDRFLSVV